MISPTRSLHQSAAQASVAALLTLACVAAGCYAPQQSQADTRGAAPPAKEAPPAKDAPGAKEKWVQAIRTDSLTNWTHLSDLGFWDNAVSRLYGIRSIPMNFLLDKEGVIIAKNLRGEELESKLHEILR